MSDTAQLTDSGAIISDTIRLPDLREVAVEVIKGGRGLPWWYGDTYLAFLPFARARVAERRTSNNQPETMSTDELGSEMRELFPAGVGNHEWKTIRNCASVCSVFPHPASMSLRKDTTKGAVPRFLALTYSHHQSDVIRLPTGEQRRWLAKAEVECWSVAQLRDAIRETVSERPALPAPAYVLSAEIDRMVAWCEEQLSNAKLEQRIAIKDELARIVKVFNHIGNVG